MKKLSMTNIRKFQLFGISYVVDIFPSPILEHLKNSELKFQRKDQIILGSLQFGWRPLFIHHTDKISAVIDGQEGSIDNRDLLAWQIDRLKSEQIYHLINKSPVDLEDIFDIDAERESDTDYSPSDWLSNSYPEYMGKALSLIDRMRSLKNTELKERLTDSFLNEGTALTSWIETEIKTPTKALKKYEGWDSPLLIVSTGEFNPVFNIDDDWLSLEEFKLFQMHIRNFDEGEID